MEDGLEHILSPEEINPLEDFFRRLEEERLGNVLILEVDPLYPLPLVDSKNPLPQVAQASAILGEEVTVGSWTP